MNLKNEQRVHPCYEKACGVARIHLPVAPKCNLQCGYCNRRYDCVSESRPGVTSQVLTADEAAEKYQIYREKMNPSVVGIAGPGDPLANWEETFRTVSNIRKLDRDVHLCMSTNGLMLAEYFQDLYVVGVRYFTMTINSVDADLGGSIYQHVDFHGKRYTGEEAGRILLNQQISALEMLVGTDAKVKINFVYIQGVNQQQVVPVARLASQYQCELLNVIPMIKVKNTLLYQTEEIDEKELEQKKKEAKEIIPLMEHCMHCRADAAGALC